MNDLNDNPAAVIAHVASTLPLPASVQKAAETAGRAAYDAQIGSGSSTARRFALQNAIKAVRNYGRAVRKSEADSVGSVTSTDFDIGPATSNQTAEQATRTTQVQALAALAGRKLQEFGGDANNPDDVTQAINLVIEDYSYGNHETLDQMEARAAANARENGFVWSSDLADARSNEDADVLNQGMGVDSNFSGRRNNPRAVYSPMPSTTGFSGSGGPAVPGGASQGATVTDGSIESVARAAFELGVRAGASGVASNANDALKKARIRAAASARRGVK